MMARSTTRSNQRPDTLMQDRLPPDRRTSCNARPDHTLGSTPALTALKRDFRSVPESRHSRCSLACLERAKIRHTHSCKRVVRSPHRPDRSGSGTGSFSVLEVFEFMQTGGFSPLRMRPAYTPTRQYVSWTLPPSRLPRIENYAVRFGPIASNWAFCSSLSVA